jgi:hypothetical protein
LKYAYKEWPHPEDTASPHSQTGREEEKACAYKMFNKKKIPPTTKTKRTLGVIEWNCQ